jgi:hypothetical protein
VKAPSCTVGPQPWAVYFAATRRSVASSVIRAAVPSTTRSIVGRLSEIAQAGLAARFRLFCVPAPLVKQKRPSSHRAPTSVTWGRPSGRVVASQVVSFGPAWKVSSSPCGRDQGMASWP